VINEHASIDPTAKIADDVTIGPWTVIGKDVEIGAGTWIGSHAVVNGPTKIGSNNRIYQYASIGEDPQSVDYRHGEKSILEIGDNNTIREYCTLNRGTEGGGGVTRIGNNNLFMAYVHVGHDCQIANHTLMVNHAVLAGHVHLKDYATVGAFVGVHQYVSIGAYSFITHAALISKDILPYVMVVGRSGDVNVHGLNIVGLKRHKFTPDVVRALRKAYTVIFRQGKPINDVINELEQQAKTCKQVQLFIDDIKNSTRGVQR